MSLQLTSTKVNKQMFRALLSIASAYLLIRVMGMLNQVVVSTRFGAGATMDAYLVASLLPIMVAQLAIGTIENSVIPAYARIRTKGTKEQASVLLNTLLNLLLIGSALLTLLMFIFRRQVIVFSAPALDPTRLGLAIDLTPFILPVLLLMVVIGFLECILNTEGQFGWPAYAGILVPLTTAFLVLAFSQSLGVVMLCVGMVIGLCLQLGVFILRVRRIGLVYRPIIDLRQPEIGLILLAAWPALLGSIISQISPLVDQIFASFLSIGSISVLSYAIRLVSIPNNVLTFSVGRAIVPYLSRQAAAKDMKAFKETLRLYLWAVGIGTLVISAFMLVLAHPLVHLFFQHGQFTAEDTNHTATTMIGFVLGITPMALVLILVRAFSALGKTRVLMYIGIFNVVANAIFDYIFGHLWQSEGIALSTSLMYFCAMSILLFTLHRMIGKLSLFTPPPPLLNAVRELIAGQFYPNWMTSRVHRYIVRAGLMLAVFAAGITGIFLDYAYTLRAAFGSLAILAFLRYHYLLLISWVLIAVMIGSPFIIFNANSFTSGLTIPTLLLLTCVPFRPTFKRMPGLTFMSIYVIWVFAGIGISTIGIGTFLTSWTVYVDFVAVAALAINVLTTERRTMGLIDAILLIAAFVALYGIYGYFTKQNGGIDPQVGFRIYSVFGAAPTLALFLSIVIPLALFRIFTLQGAKRIGGLLIIAVLLVAFSMTFARSGFISVPLSILIMALFLPSRKMRIALLSSLALLTTFIFLLVLVGHFSIFNRFFESDITTLNGRVNVWQIILSRFDPTQLLGNGFNASGILLAGLGINGIKGVSVSSYETHNLFLGTLYDHGIIGVILLLLVFISLFAGLVAGSRKSTGTHRMLFVTAIAIFVSVCLQTIEATDIMALGIGLYFWVIMALPFALYWSASQQAPALSAADFSDDEVLQPLRTRIDMEHEKAYAV